MGNKAHRHGADPPLHTLMPVLGPQQRGRGGEENGRTLCFTYTYTWFYGRLYTKIDTYGPMCVCLCVCVCVWVGAFLEGERERERKGETEREGEESRIALSLTVNHVTRFCLRKLS